MTSIARSPTISARLLILAGIVITSGASVIGFLRVFGMGGPITGMPMADMPEMFAAFGGIVLTVIGAAMRTGTSRGSARAATGGPGRRMRVLAAVVATVALTIDTSKTATLGFVMPGMRAEYGIGPAEASMLAVAGLSGTATGAFLFGNLADRIGRQRSFVIATLGFTATSMCGTMPTFAGNVLMCGLMGIAVGGLAPLLITTLADVTSGTPRGYAVVALSVVATAVGYLVASGTALWLEPTYGWRVLWLIGVPTGLLLTITTPLIPERPHASNAARATTPKPGSGTVRSTARAERGAFSTSLQWLYAGLVGVLTFGLTTWVPTLSRAAGLDTTTANASLTVAALVMVPCAILIALCYRRFGPIVLAVALAGATAALMLILVVSGLASIPGLAAAALVAALFAVKTMAAIFLPISSNLADPERRARTTGTVSLFNRLGGLSGPLVLAVIVSSVTDVLIAIAVLSLACATIAWHVDRRYREWLARPAEEPAHDSVDSVP